VFEFDWTLELLLAVLQRQGPGLWGVMSALYAGDRLVAMHLGMRTETVLHYWFPAYDRELSKYSPGVSLLRLMAEHAAGSGIRRIDLGRGDEPYKLKFASGSIPLASGIVSASIVRRSQRLAWNFARSTAQHRLLNPVLKHPARLVRRLRDHVELS
jgi:CelD/BcsL family acetyltransferase involved in cellulose biosynthesis